jgi:hypothetical protein
MDFLGIDLDAKRTMNLLVSGLVYECKLHGNAHIASVVGGEAGEEIKSLANEGREGEAAARVLRELSADAPELSALDNPFTGDIAKWLRLIWDAQAKGVF